MTQQTETQEKSGWNFSQQITMQGANLLYEAQQDFLNNSYHNCFLKTREIRLLIQTFISKDDKKKLDELERQIIKLWNKQKKAKMDLEFVTFSDGKKERQEISKAKSQYGNLLSEFRYAIASLVNKSGFGVSAKDDQSKMF